MFKKKTILILVIFSILASVVVAGCSDSSIQSQEEEIEVIEASVGDLSFEEAVDRSYCVITAKLDSIKDKETYREYDFKLGQNIVGSMNEANFCVREGYVNCTVEDNDLSYSTSETQYEVGGEYILVLDKISLVYYEEDEYMFLGDIFIQLDDAGNIIEYQRYHQKEELVQKTIKDFTNYVISITDSTKERKVYGIPYTKSTKIPDIVDASQYIVKAVVSDIHIEAPRSNRDTYRCKVTETLRGSTGEEILIVLFKDSITIGKEYLFLLNTDTEDSLIYALSSVNSVMDVESEKIVVEEITSLVSK